MRRCHGVKAGRVPLLAVANLIDGRRNYKFILSMVYFKDYMTRVMANTLATLLCRHCKPFGMFRKLYSWENTLVTLWGRTCRSRSRRGKTDYTTLILKYYIICKYSGSQIVVKHRWYFGSLEVIVVLHSVDLVLPWFSPDFASCLVLV